MSYADDLYDIRTADGALVTPGMTLLDFRGEEWTYRGLSDVPGHGRSGKVTVGDDLDRTREFYLGVFDLTATLRGVSQ